MKDLIKKLFIKRNHKWKNTIIHHSVEFGFPENISMGQYVYIGSNGYIDAKGGITIGDNVIIGPNCTIWSYNHNFKSTVMLPYDDIDILKPVTIGCNVWICSNVSIAPGVTIGEGAIIGIGAVVTNNIPACAITIGNPAQVVKYRDIEVYEKLKKENSFFMKLKLENKIKDKKCIYED